MIRIGNLGTYLTPGPPRTGGRHGSKKTGRREMGGKGREAGQGFAVYIPFRPAGKMSKLVAETGAG